MNRKYAVVVLIVVLAAFGAVMSFADSQGKVNICHIPPGNPANAHMISVSVNAVPAHLGHGDPPPGQDCGGGPPPQQ